MYSNQPHHNQQNRHPNRFRVQEANIDQISKQYVLDGQRLKVKSILYKQKQTQHTPLQKDNAPQQQKEPDMSEYEKLEYLDQLGVLNQEEKNILKQMKLNKQKEVPTANRDQRIPLQRLDSGYEMHPKPQQQQIDYQQDYFSQMNPQFSQQPQYQQQQPYYAQKQSQYTQQQPYNYQKQSQYYQQQPQYSQKQSQYHQQPQFPCDNYYEQEGGEWNQSEYNYYQ